MPQIRSHRVTVLLLGPILLIPVLTSCTMSASTDAASANSPAATSAAAASEVATPNASSSTLPDDAVITYRFLDSSVPPQYHRSWTLTVTKQDEEIAVDSYGDVLGGGRAETPEAVWAGLAAGLPQIEALTVSDDTQGCTGGTGEAVTVESGGAVLVDLTVYECGGVNAEAAQALRAWIAPARAEFPSTDELAPPGQE